MATQTVRQSDIDRLRAIDDAYADLVEALNRLEAARAEYKAARKAAEAAQHNLNCAVSADYVTLFDRELRVAQDADAGEDEA